MRGLYVHEAASRQFLFGLDWLPLITGRADRAAYALARRQRASHYVYAGQAAASAGFCSLRASQTRQGPALHSAAQCLARLYASGTVAVVTQVADGLYWFAAVHEGAVIVRTDSLHDSPDQALHLIQDLQRAHPQLMILGLDEAPPPSLEALVAACDSSTHLIPVRGRVAASTLCVGLLAASLAAWAVAARWPLISSQPNEEPPIGAQEISQLWEQAVEGAVRGIALHGVANTHALLRSFYSLPVWVSGWSLTNVACAPQAESWACEANYARIRPEASNDRFLAAAPSGWTVQFPSIDRAQPSWRVAITPLPLVVGRLRSSTHNQRHWQSSLQAIRPAFTQMVVGQSSPLQGSVPISSAGTVLPRPPRLSLPAVRAMQVGGPLRSLSLLLANVQDVRWSKVVLSVADIPAPSLKSSRFVVSLVGELYELHQTQPALP